jgi:putative endopeptidase
MLQAPFYNQEADEAINYGAIGCVIGHELTHLFDDQGSKYNSFGNIENWWSENDLNQFTNLGSKLSEQFSVLEPLPGIFVNGKLTLGENIADLGGINASYDGLQLYLKNKEIPLIDGYSQNQRFFISWATGWRTKFRDNTLKNQIKTDPHTPGMYRAYVPLQNMDSFYKAFDIKPGDKMYMAPEKRVKIW